MSRNMSLIEEQDMLSFFKNFQAADLSSELMRALPLDFILKVSEKDLSDKMVIRAQWGKTWHLKISRNPSFYYIERRGWDQFVSDNALGENEFVTFTHRGKMIFHVNIFEQNGREMLKPRKPLMGGIKREGGESSYKDVKKEQEETNVIPKDKRSKKVKEKMKQPEPNQCNDQTVFELWRLRGDEAYRNGDSRKAEECYTHGIYSSPSRNNSQDSVKHLALCYGDRAAARISLERLREAISDCEMAASLDPSYIKAYMRAGK